MYIFKHRSVFVVLLLKNLVPICMKLKKFSKKKNFLGIPLFNFLIWRETNVFSNSHFFYKKQKFLNESIASITSSDLTIEEELLCIQNFIGKENIRLKSNIGVFPKRKNSFSFKPLHDSFMNDFTNNDSIINNIEIKKSRMHNFFPHKKAFMHYWIWPFIGLAGYIFLTKNWIHSRRMDQFNLTHKYLEKKSHLVNTKKQINHHTYRDVHTYKITNFKDQTLNRLFSKIDALEKNELDNLWQFYFFSKKKQIRNFIYPSFISIQKSIAINTKKSNSYSPYVLWHSLKHQNADEFPNRFIPLNVTSLTKEGYLSTYKFPITSYKNASYRMDNLFKTSILYGQNYQQELFKKNSVIKSLQPKQSNLLQNVNLILDSSTRCNKFGNTNGNYELGNISNNLQDLDLPILKNFYDLSSNFNHKIHQNFEKKYLIKNVSMFLKKSKPNNEEKLHFLSISTEPQSRPMESYSNKSTNLNQNLLYKSFQWLHFYHIFSKNVLTEFIDKPLWNSSLQYNKPTQKKQEKYKYQWLVSKYSIETKKRIFELLILRFLNTEINQQILNISKNSSTHKKDFCNFNSKFTTKRNSKKKKFFFKNSINERKFNEFSKKNGLNPYKKQNISEFLNQTYMFFTKTENSNVKVDNSKSLFDIKIKESPFLFTKNFNVALIPSIVSSQNRIPTFKLQQPIRMTFQKNEKLHVSQHKDYKSEILSNNKRDIDLRLAQKKHFESFQNSKTKLSYYLTTNSSLFSPFLDHVKTPRNIDQSFLIKSNNVSKMYDFYNRDELLKNFHFNLFKIQNTYNILRNSSMFHILEKFHNLEIFLEKCLLKILALLKNHQIFLIYQHDLLIDKSLSFINQISNSSLSAQKAQFHLKKISNLYKNSRYFLTLKPKRKYQILMRKNLFNRKQDKIFKNYLNSKLHKRKQKKINISYKDFIKKDFISEQNQIYSTKNSFLNQHIKSKYHLNLTTYSRSKYLQKSLRHLKNHLNNQLQILKNSSHPFILEVKQMNQTLLTNPYIDSVNMQSNILHGNKIENIHLQKKQIQNHLNLSPNTILRRIGFLFVYKSEKINIDTLNRLDRQRSLQKKRRRKKRKRFYPRPIWLRFLLSKNFLINRYFSYKKWFHYEKKHLGRTLKNQKNREVYIMNAMKSDFIQKKQSFKFSTTSSITENQVLNVKKMSENKLSSFFKKRFFYKTFKKHKKMNKEIYRVRNSSMIYRNYKQQWDNGFQNNPNTEKSICQKAYFLWIFPNFNNHKYYSISNNILNDFQKSRIYWSRSSLIPYIKRLENSLKQMRIVETKAQQSNFFETFIKSRFFLDENQKFSNTLNLNEQKKFPLSWYLNLKNTFTNYDYTSNSFLFNRLHENTEYDRILYEKNSESIQNAKFAINDSTTISTPTINPANLNNQDHKEFKNYGYHKRGKQEKKLNPSFWERIALSVNRTFHLSKIHASRLGSLADPSLKPYGDLPTLRTLWALNQSNILSNLSESMSGSLVETKALWGTLKSRDQKKQSISNKFFYTSWNTFFPKSLKKLSVLKLEMVNKKLRYAGFGLNDQKAYLRDLKQRSKNRFHLTEKTTVAHKASVGMKQDAKNFLKELSPIFIQMQPQKHPKRTIHFWWSKESFYPNGLFSEWKDKEFYDLWMDQSSFESFFEKNPCFESGNATALQAPFFKNIKTSIGENAIFMNLALTCILSCSILFHLCNLFGLIQISEIRSFSKFLVLILYKFSNCYLIIIYSIFSSIKNSFKQLKLNVKSVNLSKESNLSFSLFSDFTSTVKNQKKNFRFLLKKTNHLNNYEMIYILSKYDQMSSDQESYKNFVKNFNYQTKTYLNEYYKINMKYQKMYERSTLLEMCFYLPNLKRFFDQKMSFFDWSKSIFKNIDKKNKYYKFKFAENEIFSFPKNFKNISYKISNNFGFQKRYLKLPKMKHSKVYLTKIQNLFWLFILYMTKSSILYLYGCIGLFSGILFKMVEILESLMLIIYKFLEKPAEFMIEWIAQIFLIEWSSDITSFIPESFDIYTWRSYSKLARGSRAFGLFGWFIQRHLWCFFEIFMDLATKPDSDLMNRQKKGMIFWDIWAEILMIAAQKYQINILSLMSLKEEQENFLERLLDDPNWFSMKYPIKKSLKTIRNEKLNNTQMLLNLKQNKSKMSFLLSLKEEKQSKRKDPEIYTSIQEKQSQALADLVFLAKMTERPTSWWNSFLNFNGSNSNSIGDEKFHISKTYFIVRNSSSNSFARSNSFDLFIEKFNNYTDITFENHFNQQKDIWRRWAANQYFSDKNIDTDLFIDVHPPKSFSQLNVFQGYINTNRIEPGSLKNKLKPNQEKNSNKLEKDLLNSETRSSMISGSGLHALGSLTCQIYSGLFSKQVAKNILVVGEPGNRQNLLIYALAGETELKMITDNAHRYGHIQRGVAVGMKLLRDVFDGLVLHTPCLFLIEDIHVIGERRPMPNIDSFFPKGSGPISIEEVHEKNQLIYMLNKHVISDFKKPYKGDFSLLLPTNHFCFDLFLGVSPPKIRKAGLSPRSPLFSINPILKKDSEKISIKSSAITYKSILQVPSHQIFAPPATSPFTILGLKEQRKFKPNKIVKEIPWGGLASGREADQMMSIPKVMYSIRAKIAFLADMAINQLGVKLDMITDLLVIMDNVRSNRGFVVFATTHLPFVLDPALRRPGRFDETISLSLLPTFMNRIEILKTHLSQYSSTFEFFDYSFFVQNLNETDLSNLMSRAKLLLFHNYNFLNFSEWRKTFNTISANPSKTYYSNNSTRVNVIFSVNQAMKFLTHQTLIEPKKILSKYDSAVAVRQPFSILSRNAQLLNSYETEDKEVNLLNLLKNSYMYNAKFPSSSSMLSLTYSQIGKFMIQSRVLNDNRCFRLISNFRSSAFYGSISTGNAAFQTAPLLESNINLNMFTNLYDPSFDLQNHLMYLLSEKIGEFFICNNSFVLKKPNFSNFFKPNNNLHLNDENLKTKTMKLETLSLRKYLTNPGDYSLKQNFSLNTSDKFWSSATSFVFSFLQKRYLYHKNLLVTKLLYFHDISIQREPSSPPASSILMPAKKYENFKRTEFDFQQKRVNSILEKIQIHQQQRFMKNLYQQPVTEWFQSHSMKNHLTTFSHSIKELGYYDSFMKKTSSVNCYYKNRILNRQRFSIVNQWWNGQLAEHNLEKVFSSDVDWRSMFIESFGDLVIDFPDAEQYYNPKLRRWFLQSTYGGYWQTFEKSIPYEIYQHFMLLCFNKAFNQLDTEREILDDFAYTFLQKGFLKEIDLISNLSKFSISSTDYKHRCL